MDSWIFGAPGSWFVARGSVQEGWQRIAGKREEWVDGWASKGGRAAGAAPRWHGKYHSVASCCVACGYAAQCCAPYPEANHLHKDLLTLRKNVLHVVDAVGGELRDVDEAVLAKPLYLHKGAILLHVGHLQWHACCVAVMRSRSNHLQQQPLAVGVDAGCHRYLTTPG